MSIETYNRVRIVEILVLRTESPVGHMDPIGFQVVLRLVVRIESLGEHIVQVVLRLVVQIESLEGRMDREEGILLERWGP